jgi:hypothetical protein
MYFRAPRLVLLLGLVACGPDIPEPIWKGKYLHYRTTTSEPVCRGSFYRQEQHAVALAQVLGVELHEVMHYTKVTDRGELAEYCDGLKGKGCAYVEKPYAFGIRGFNFHEITHLVAYSNGIRGPLPFSEGFAEVFNDGADSDTALTPLDQVLRNFTLDDKDYRTAALFARFLIERHGLERFVHFLRTADSDAGFAKFSPIFEQVFGEPLEAAMVEFESYPECADMSNRIALVDCSLPLEPWEDGAVTLTANVACDEDDVLGPAQDDVMFTTRGFHVDQAGSYLFYASKPEGWSGFRVVKCGSCWDRFDMQPEPGSMEVHDLTPGRYYVLLGRMIEQPAEFGLVVWKI